MKGKPRKPKPTKAQVRLRAEEVLRIRLDGAEFWDVREYVREKEAEAGSPWELPEGHKPLSDASLWRYIGMADALIADSCRSSRKRLLRRHLAQRRNLYAKAVSQGDVRAALAVLDSEAKLLDLCPAAKHELTGKAGGPLRHEHAHRDLTGLSEDELQRQYKAEVEQAPGDSGPVR